MKNRSSVFYIFSSFSLFSVIGSFALGVYLGKIYFGKYKLEPCFSSNTDMVLLCDVYHRLEEKFVDKAKIDKQKMIYGAAAGMVKSIGDPYTVFFTPKETKHFEENVKGSFEGVGMEIGIKKNQLQVIAPLEGTPAQKAGLRAGDKILEINGTSTSDLTIDQAADLIRGPKGTEVELTILRKNWEKPKKIRIVRDVIKIPSLKLEIKDVKDEKIAYIKIYQFSERTEEDFSRAADKILKSSAKKIILDLRNNPGGYLVVSQQIAGWFLKKGEIVVIEDFGERKKQKVYMSDGPSVFVNYPVVVLINNGSASASEILAGALRDNRGVKLIGETSFGKGSVQELIEGLKNNSSLKVTVAKWLTPKGKCINEKGLKPDIEVKMTEKDYEEGKDPQLEKALEIIKNL